MNAEARPAFYALPPGGWRDYVTLLHPPYTLWHLSYVAVGASLAPHMKWGLLGWTTLAFFLAMGVGAHALDELKSRPLRTRIPDRTLVALALVSVSAASAIGIVVALDADLWLLAFVGFGAAIVVAYNLELFGGGLHNTAWFAASWGAFPALTGYFASAHTVRGEAIAAALFAFLTSYAQRVLSTPVRHARRNLGDAELARAAEIGLQLIAAAMPALAAGLLLARVR